MSLTRARTSSRSSRKAASSDVVLESATWRATLELLRQPGVLFGRPRLFGAQLRDQTDEKLDLVLESIDRVEIQRARDC
jgi:hypothetical protein